MLFKDLKVGDTVYVKNPIYWSYPIKKTIGQIVSLGGECARLDFYDENGCFLGSAWPNRSRNIGDCMFVDFEGFKQSRIEYHKKIIKNLNDEIDRLKEQLRLANNDLEIANLMEEKD